MPGWAPHHKLIVDSSVGTKLGSKPLFFALQLSTVKLEGPENQRGHPPYELWRCSLEEKQGIRVGEERSYFPSVHVHDLSGCYLRLVGIAVEGGGKVTWGRGGYHSTENGEHIWRDISKAVASAAHK